MKRISQASYIIRIIFFVLHFYFVFIMLDRILDAKYVGPIFLVLYLLYIIVLLLELISKKQRYKNDLVYNIMQIGLYSYLIVLSLRVNIYKVYVGKNTSVYFTINYIILSILFVFVLLYSQIEFRSKKLH